MQRDEIRLRRRSLELLELARASDPRAGRLLDVVSRLGHCALFGGVVRDMWFESPKQFDSDLDIVVDVHTARELATAMKPFATGQNSYGGLRAWVGRWRFDVWPLSETWAFRQGYVNDISFQGLLRTTFFNWDAILLDLQSESLFYDPTYFAAIRSRILEINLEPSANPEGNAVRALNMIYLRHALVGPKLALYLSHHLPRLLARSKDISDPRLKMDRSYLDKFLSQLTAHIAGESAGHSDLLITI
jgi:hypothetical protein